jgi:hypothetical protein
MIFLEAKLRSVEKIVILSEDQYQYYFKVVVTDI